MATGVSERGKRKGYGRKATWAEMDQRLEEFTRPEDRDALRKWVDYRRDVERVSPGTLRIYLQRIRAVSLKLKAPLLVAAEDGSLEKAVRAMARDQKHPWQWMGLWPVFLRFHGKPHQWAKRPKGLVSTRAKRSQGLGQRRWNLVEERDFARGMEACGHPMHRALLHVLWETGMRPGELLSLRYEDIERDGDGYFTAHLPPEEDAHFSLKTGPRSIVLIDSVAALREWLSKHPKKKGPLWLGERNAVASYQWLNKHLGLWTDHTATDFRHTAATRYTKEGWNEAQMRAYFGWESDSPMPSYYAEFSQSDANRMRLQRAGILNDENEAHKPIVPLKCPRCNTDNTRENTYCYECGAPLKADLVHKALEEARRYREAAEVEQALVSKMSRAELMAAFEQVAKAWKSEEGPTEKGEAL